MIELQRRKDERRVTGRSPSSPHRCRYSVLSPLCVGFSSSPLQPCSSPGEQSGRLREWHSFFTRCALHTWFTGSGASTSSSGTRVSRLVTPVSLSPSLFPSRLFSSPAPASASPERDRLVLPSIPVALHDHSETRDILPSTHFHSLSKENTTSAPGHVTSD